MAIKVSKKESGQGNLRGELRFLSYEILVQHQILKVCKYIFKNSLSYIHINMFVNLCLLLCQVNGTAKFKKFKQLFEHQHILLLGDIWWKEF